MGFPGATSSSPPRSSPFVRDDGPGVQGQAPDEAVAEFVANPAEMLCHADASALPSLRRAHNAGMTVLLTGAAGRVGSVLAPAFTREGLNVRLTDATPIDDVPPGYERTAADLRDFEAVRAVTTGVSAVVHLGAIPCEARFPDIMDHNIATTYNVLEAARQCRVRRVVLASSIHATGYYPAGATVRPDDPVRPDTFYGVSKVTLEALGYLYARKCGLEVVCLRIASFEREPSAPRHRATWLSHGDGVRLFLAALRAELPEKRFIVAYGTSDVPESWLSREGWDVLGYEPRDVPKGLATHDSDEVHGGEFARYELPGT